MNRGYSFALECERLSLFKITVDYSTLWLYNNLSNQSGIGWHSCCFQSFAITNNAVINNFYVHHFTCMLAYVCMEKRLWVEFLGQKVGTLLILTEIAKLFPLR